MTLPQEKPYTYADIIEWDESTRYELYDGQPVALAAPQRFHQHILGELFAQLHAYLQGKKCQVYMAPFDVCLFAEADTPAYEIDTVLQPDISVICDPNKLTDHGCSGAPDLVIEILSPSSQRTDRLTKFNLYQQARVQEYWIVDPEAQVALVHTLEEGSYHSPAAYNAKAAVPVGVLEGCVIDMAEVFGE